MVLMTKVCLNIYAIVLILCKKLGNFCGSRTLKSTGRHSSFLISTRQQGLPLKSTCDMGTLMTWRLGTLMTWRLGADKGLCLIFPTFRLTKGVGREVGGAVRPTIFQAATLGFFPTGPWGSRLLKSTGPTGFSLAQPNCVI